MRDRILRVLCCCVAALALAGCDWAQLGFDASNTSDNGFEPAFTPTSVTHLTVAWSQACRCGRPLVANGVVYDTDDSTPGTTSVRAFGAASGTQLWTQAFPVSPPLLTVQLRAVAGGLVYLVVGSSVVALDARTGLRAWSVDPPAPGTGVISLDHLLVDQSGFPTGGPESTTAFVDVTAAISNANPVSEISAIDRTGHITWSATPGGVSAGFAGIKSDNQPDSTQRTLDAVSTITTVTPPVFLVTQYDEASGRLIHQVVVRPGGPTVAFPPPDRVAAADGLVFFNELAPHDPQALFAVDPTDGTVVWSGFGGAPYAIAHGFVISTLPGPATGLVGLDAVTGKVVWEVGGPSGVAIAATIAFDSIGGVIEARNLTTGTQLGTFSVPGEPLGSVTPSEGLIFTVSAQHLYALTPNAA